MRPSPARSGPDLLAIGECMVEFARRPDGSFAQAQGGDTFNTAVYAARLGLGVSYATALGDDRYSQAILDLAAAEGVSTALVPCLPGRAAGLYVIDTDAAGERSFTYWRDRAPARELFDRPEAGAVAEAMAGAGVVLVSGITLSLYGETGLARLFEALTAARAAGARLAFDANYRPRGWGGDRDRARAVMGRMLALTDLALPTFEDEAALWGDAEPAATLDRLLGLGVREVAIKNGGEGALMAGGDMAPVLVPVPAPVELVDTTAAGDSFNAGYFAGRRRGLAPAEAALLGHRLAGIVVGHRGAIVHRRYTEALACSSSGRTA